MTSGPSTPDVAGAAELRRARWTLALIVGVTTLAKLIAAATTLGTEDVARWMAFADAVARVGPIEVYGQSLEVIYNHPPLVGYLLQAVHAATTHGVDFPLAIRLPSVLADVVTPFIVLELVRVRAGHVAALIAAASVALSPALFAISGFHGNTDAVVVMLTLLAVYLLIDRRSPGWAGVAIALGVSVKLVPIVVVPALLVVAATRGRRTVAWFVGAGVLAGVPLWAPPSIVGWQSFADKVLGYQGGVQEWGLLQILASVGGSWPSWARGTPRFLVVVTAAGVAAVMAFRRPTRAAEAAALALPGLLLLAPGFGIQYLAWAVAPAYVGAGVRAATAYNVSASVLALAVYTHWSSGLPWYVAYSTSLTTAEVVLALLAWLALASVVVDGMRRIVRDPAPETGAGSDEDRSRVRA